MELQLLKLSICVLNKKEVRTDDVRRHHHCQHQQLPHEYLQTVVQLPMQSQDLHNAKWRCGSGLSDTKQTYYNVAPAHGVVADGKRRISFSSSFPTDTALYPSSRDGCRFVGSTESEKTLCAYSRDGCKFVGSGPEQTNFVSILQRRVAGLLALPREPRDFAPPPM
jgi:hypothetical protein